MQPLDFTTLAALCSELNQNWLPAKLEQVYQQDRYTLALGLRTLGGRGWLILSWHPQGARMHLGGSPPRDPDTFTFSKQVAAQLKGLALGAVGPCVPWERVVDLPFAARPGEPALGHLYLEVMGKYSNLVLVNGDDRIVSVAHQVSSQQSRVRPVQTGQAYVLPPPPQGQMPRLEESLESWRERVSLIPAPVAVGLRQTYRGLSSALAADLVEGAGLDPQGPIADLREDQWQELFVQWQRWLKALATGDFRPQWTQRGYTVLGWTVRGSGAGALAVWGDPEDRGDGALGVDRAPGYTPNDSPGYSPNDSPGHSPGDTQGHSPDRPTLGNPKGRSALPPLQEFIGSYYGDRLRCHEYQQLHHQLRQRVRHHWTKAHQKATGFRQKLEDSALAEDYRYRADLIMAHLHQEPSQSPSPSAIVLKDFATGEPVTLTLNPEKNWVQNAQGLYRQHQKLKRAAQAVAPLLAAVEQELQYLEQVESLLEDPPEVPMEADWLALQEIAEELQQEGYGSRHGSRQDPGQSAPRSPNSSPSKANKAPSPRSGKSGGRRSGSQGSSPPKSGGKASHRDSQADFHRYHTPNGLEILVGRNNRQNDALTFRVATSYDLWFHTQEIPGSHVLLRLQPGQVPDGIDLQHTAHVAAYHSRARHSDRAPVVYTEPRHVYKPKGAGPGLVIYKHERILWGSPHQVQPLPPQDL